MSKKDKIAKKNSAKIKPGRLARREAITGLLFVTPWIIGACIFLAYTMGTSFWYALNNIRMTPMGKKFTYVGMGNFTQILLADVDFLAFKVDVIPREPEGFASSQTVEGGEDNGDINAFVLSECQERLQFLGRVKLAHKLFRLRSLHTVHGVDIKNLLSDRILKGGVEQVVVVYHRSLADALGT